ncbi:helix-turn-helix transcriptional regulator [Roseomonas sp. PWR1]|uniref:Helix-turn-helix transcriptional regulator n=1 Tax=Roseomonas nitratireducens TaxID=2820810 RepID=A0ABS4B078_9PROT|nr:helix-turn-helix transcriptional regulator [Neoroseomonas nitratireducens]MBP0467014.1 helix-turn-helix transcriptional regulator [Neoroseomonas nitratireducens]
MAVELPGWTHARIGALIAQERARLDMTQEAMATKAGIHRSTVARIEVGDPAAANQPRLDLLAFLARAGSAAAAAALDGIRVAMRAQMPARDGEAILVYPLCMVFDAEGRQIVGPVRMSAQEAVSLALAGRAVGATEADKRRLADLMAQARAETARYVMVI